MRAAKFWAAEELHKRYTAFKRITARDRWYANLPDHDRQALIEYRLELRAKARLVPQKDSEQCQMNHIAQPALV